MIGIVPSPGLPLLWWRVAATPTALPRARSSPADGEGDGHADPAFTDLPRIIMIADKSRTIAASETYKSDSQPYVFPSANATTTRERALNPTSRAGMVHARCSAAHKNARSLGLWHRVHRLLSYRVAPSYGPLRVCSPPPSDGRQAALEAAQASRTPRQPGRHLPPLHPRPLLSPK